MFYVVLSPFEAPQRSMKMKSFHYLFQLLILGYLGEEGLIKFFLLAFSYISKKMVTNMKLAFTNVPYRHTFSLRYSKVVKI